MPLIVAGHAGFCVGVSRAMEKAFQAAEQAAAEGVPCYALGEVIHNGSAIGRLREAGVRIAERLEDVPRGSYLILRSHGVGPDVMEACVRRELRPVDCTCAYVQALHRIVSEGSSDGTPVYLIGDRGHPEVLATAAWCKSVCTVVGTAEEAQRLPASQRALAVSQTTFPEDEWERIIACLKQKIAQLTVHKTICRATAQRQQEAKELASRCDGMVVVGGEKSANTRKLFEACRALCPKTCLVERGADIPPHLYHIHTEYIGITAGASTPDWSLKEVVTRMNDMEKDVQSIPEETVTTQTPLTEEEQRKQDFMADIEKSFVRIHPGQTLTGTVVQANDDEVCVNIGYKSDGIIKRDDLVDKDVKLGDEIEVEVVKVNDGEGNVILSQRNIINRKTWDALMEKYENGEYVEAVGKEAVKGGLIADVNGIRAFVPASRLAQRYVENIAQFVGQPMKLKIIDVDKQKKRIVASRKDVLVEESAAKKAAAWEKLEEGAVVKGIVRRFADFGAFVDLGGVDGLIHVTDLSWGHVNHPKDVLSVNQEVEVKILSLDREKERIQLGYKQLQPKPWDNIEEKYPVGAILERPVVRIRPFGAFIELEPGVDGLVHISQCALTRVNKVEDVLTVGQMVKVKVLGVDPEAKRISLSIREALADEAYTDEQPMDIPGDEMTAEEAPVEE